MAALVARARQGDGAAIETLFHLHLPGVHRVVYRLVGPQPDVEDLVQTVFVEAFRSLAGFRGDALFSTWLQRIAVRVTMHGQQLRTVRTGCEYVRQFHRGCVVSVLYDLSHRSYMI